MADTSLVLSQPSVAARPSRASMPSTSRHGYCRHIAAKPFRIGQCRRADHQPRQPEIQQLADRLLVANAAAELALDIDCRQDLLHARQIDRQPFAGTFQIDDVQVLGALLGKLPGNVGRVLRRRRFPADSRPACSRTHFPPRRSIAGQICIENRSEVADRAGQMEK